MHDGSLKERVARLYFRGVLRCSARRRTPSQLDMDRGVNVKQLLRELVNPLLDLKGSFRKVGL